MNQHVPIVPLLDRHKKFADEYLRTSNASESARVAGCSPKSAHVTGYKWLKRTDVIEYLRAHAAIMSAPRDQVTKQGEELDNRVIKELTDLAFANMADLITIGSDGQPSFDLSNATPEQLKAISNLKTKTTRRYDNQGKHIATDTELAISIADKYRGLELLGKHRGLFKADEQRVVLDVADRLLSGRRRLALMNDDSENYLDGQGGGGCRGMRGSGGGGGVP
jgi:phage terminase small subunit